MSAQEQPAGPLSGVTVLELGSIGPGPFVAMLLSDMGADVVRIDRPGLDQGPNQDLLLRGRRSIVLDIRAPEARRALFALVRRSDVLLEGFRPGTVERLGVGPDECLGENPGLVFCRLTGWGQEGPAAMVAGHDLTYLAVTGALHAIGSDTDVPPPPLNLVGDFAGGGVVAAFGIVSALLERGQSGRGQVIDAAMVDGIAALSTSVISLWQAGQWTLERARNLVDGAAPFYRCYATADDRFVAVGAIEPKFFSELVRLLELDPGQFDQADRATWDEQSIRLARKFRERSRDEWAGHFEGTDACVAPVLDFEEAAAHPQLAKRSTYMQVDGRQTPAPVPRLSRTAGAAGPAWRGRGRHTVEVLAEAGIPQHEIASLLDSGAAAALGQ